MIQLPGYTVTEKLYTSAVSSIWRGQRDLDGLDVVIKWLSVEAPTVHDLARYRYSADLLQGLELPGVTRMVDVTELENRPVQVYADSHGVSLKKCLLDDDIDIVTAARIGAEVAGALQLLHAERILHRDINPGNIVVNGETGHVELIDFDIASRLLRQRLDPSSVDQLQGTLRYIAPEQTGRMNRPIDHRVDLYSLGATLFEMLTGRPPFEHSTALGLVHAHIAQDPPAPHVIEPDVPEQLSAIVMRLLAKNPDDRYQSATALHHDLLRCYQELQANGAIEPFELAQSDFSAWFALPDKLYGRDSELAQLRGGFERASQGRTELVLVDGFSGIGKSRLVQELQPLVARDRGRFITGEHSLMQHAPYLGLKSAVGRFIGKIWSLPEAELERWRARLLTALGPAARAVTEIVPGLGKLLGETPPLQPLQPAEAGQRVVAAFTDLVRALPQPDQPLVLFLDDLQWADAGTFDLLTSIHEDPRMRGLLVVGAYRAEELSKSPLLQRWVDKRRGGDRVSAVSVGPLSREALADFVGDTMRCSGADAAVLTAVVWSKTHGNPFFVEQLLLQLHDNGVIAQDVAAMRWTWDIDAVRNLAVTADVADLMAQRVGHYEGLTSEALATAACVGSTFDLQSLVELLNIPAAEVSAALFPALRDELVAPIADALQMGALAGAGGGDAAAVRFRFLHDKVQEAGQALLEDDERGPLHLRIGRALRARATGYGPPDELFEVVDQLNCGAQYIEDDDERRQLAELNLDAGKKAMAASAFGAAFAYFQAGIDARGPGAWSATPKLTWELHRHGAEAAQLAGEFATSEQLLAAAFEHAVVLPQKVDLYRLRIGLCLRQSRSVDAAMVGVEALSLFGFEAPADPAGWMQLTMAEGGALAKRMAGREIEALTELPPMRDPAAMLQTGLLASVIAPAFTVPHILPFVVMRMVNLSVEHGNAVFSPLAYVFMGLLCCGRGDYRSGRRYGELALALIDRSPVKTLASPVHHVFANFIDHWTAPYESAAEHANKAIVLGLSTGNMAYAGWAANNIPYLGLARGEPLEEAWQEATLLRDTVNDVLKYQDGIAVSRVYRHAIAQLAGMDEERRALEQEGLEAPVSFTMLLDGVRLMLAAIFHDIDTAAALSEKLAAMAARAPAHFVVPELRIYQSIALASTAEGASEQERAGIEKTLSDNVALLQGWASHCPDNNQWKLHLAVAELAAVRGDEAEAADHYDRAMAAARSARRMHAEALSAERAARYFFALDRPRVARGYLTDAHFGYVRWGATAKARALEAQFPAHLRQRMSDSGIDLASTPVTTTRSTSSLLDFQSILKASQAISTQLNLDGVLSTLIEVAVENAGADRGVLLMQEGEQWLVQAQLDMTEAQPVVGQGIPLEDAPMARAVARYVIRTASREVIGDARSSDRYAADPWVKERSVRSLACTPVTHQGNVIAAIYVENSRVPDAFTEQRCEVLDMLASQAAISIRNARLYDQTERLARSTARFVPQEFLHQLGAKSVLDVELGDAVEREMTVLFSDIRGFTSISEAMTPIEIFQYVNGYLRRAGPVIRRHGGFIDKYIGDAVMALFPHGDEGAVRAAMGMLHEVRAYNAEVQAQGKPTMKIGVGVHRGNVILGTMGEVRRIDVSVLSDTVNTSARLESLTKEMGVSLIVSGEVQSRIGEELASRYLGKTVLRGRTGSTALYEVFAADDAEAHERKIATREEFEGAVRAFERGEIAAARAGFERVIAADPGDIAARKYLQREVAPTASPSAVVD